MSIQESLRIVPKGDIAVVEFDLIGEKVNKLSSPVMYRFKEVVEELKKSKFKAVMLISRKPNIFVAGADIDEIKKLTSKEQVIDVLKASHEILNAWEDLPMPTIAVINGACLGGGCELVLACDYRIASDDRSTRIGLPEVRLGIIPGFGGCLRLPRVVGLQASLDIILAGKSVDATKALKMGLVDEAVPASLLEEKALVWAGQMASGKKGKRRKVFKARNTMQKILESFAGRCLVYSQAKKTVMEQTKGFYPAPLKALEVVKNTYGFKNREKATQVEMDAFSEVAVTEVSKNLIDVFYLLEAIKKQSGVENKEVQARDVKHLGVLGAGVMGGGIGQVAADAGVEVRLKDISNDALALGFKSARDVWNKAMEKKRLTKYDFDRKMSLISGGLDYSGFKHMDVVIEAIVEDMNIKKKVIAECASHCSPQTIMATNTSSLSVTEMAEGHPHPENFVGMHFFNPVNRMPLVEVIRGKKTGDEATATIFALAKKMGKMPVVVKDGPGFLVNRLLLPWLGEAIFMLQEGMSIETVDHWFTHEFGMPMGPYRLLDEIGWDVAVKVLKIFRASLGERVEIPQLADKFHDTGRLGRKNNKGFYLYDDRGKQLAVDKSVYGALGLGTPTNRLTQKECLERGVFAMVNEAALALIEDRIVVTPQDVDLAMILGTGFPPFRGGLLKYADSVGSEYVVAELEDYASRFGKRFKPSTPLVNMAKGNRKFY